MRVMRYSEKLTKLCESRNWDQADLWRAIGKSVRRSTLSNWFNDQTRPDMATGLLVARALGVPLDYLADDAMEKPPEMAPSVGLSADEEVILDMARTLGIERAKERMLLVPQGAAGIKLSPTPEPQPHRSR